MIRSLDLRILVLSGLLAAAPVAFGQSALPAYALSYSVTTGVTSVLADSSVITLPPGEVNTTATATITVLNQGLGTGALTGASVSGAGFQVTGLPALPASIPADRAFGSQSRLAPRRLALQPHCFASISPGGR